MINCHYTSKGEYPQPYGNYLETSYPLIPCLVKGQLSTGYGWGVRFWNHEFNCWDNEEADDFECEPNQVEAWCYLDDIINNLNK